MTLMTPEMSKLYSETDIQIAPELFGQLCAKASQIKKDIRAIQKAVKDANRAYEQLQGNAEVTNFFSLSGPDHRIYELPQGSVDLEFKFREGQRKNTSCTSTTPYEGLRVGFNNFCNGFFYVLRDLRLDPDDRDIDHEWVRLSSRLEDGLAYDIKPDAISTVELWLEINDYPPEVLAAFKTACSERGLIEPIAPMPSAPAPRPDVRRFRQG